MKKKLQFINIYVSDTLSRIYKSEKARHVRNALLDIALLAVLAVFTSWCAATCSSETHVIAAPITPKYVSIYNNDTNKVTDVKNTTAAPRTVKKTETYTQHGIASHMGHSLNGRVQANGTKHNKNALICAHRTLPFGTVVKVTNKSNGKSVTVTVTDRGPYVKGRKVDLSLAAARKIGMEETGVAPVVINVIKQ